MPSECLDNSLQLECILRLLKGAVGEALQNHRGVVGEEHLTHRDVEEEAPLTLKGVAEQQHQKEEVEASPLTGQVVLRILQVQVVPITGEEVPPSSSQAVLALIVWPRIS